MVKYLFTVILLLSAATGFAQASASTTQLIHLVDSMVKKTIGVNCGTGGYNKRTSATFSGDTYYRVDVIYGGENKKIEENNEFGFADIHWETMIKIDQDPEIYCDNSNLRMLNVTFSKNMKRFFNGNEDSYPTLNLELVASDIPLVKKVLMQLSEAAGRK